MENIEQKAAFLKNDLVPKVAAIPAYEPQRWGKMNAQQMVEHLADAFREGNGKTPRTIVYTEDVVEKYRAFLVTEKSFRENTKNSMMGEEPASVRNATMQDAVKELQEEIDNFFSTFEQDKSKTITNPFFGELNYGMWVQLLHKHAVHHLKQFGVETEG